MDKNELKKLSKDELISIIGENCDSEGIIPLNINYQSLLDATTDIIFVLDRDGNIVYINSAWKRFYPSISTDSIKGHYSKNIPHIEKERASYVFDSIIKEGLVIENELMKTVDESGHSIYFIATFSPIQKDGDAVLGLVGIMRNITERYHAEKKLKENSKILEDKVKEQLRQSEELKGLKDLNDDILMNAPIGVFMMDPSGIMLSENPALKEIMGHGDETRIGVNLLEYSGFVDVGLGEMFNQCLLEKKMMKKRNVPYVPIIGDRELIINIIMDPLFDERGAVRKVLVIVEDNTEQAKNLKKLFKAERLSSIGILASGVASELKSYVNKMSMDLNFVGNNVDSDNPAFEYVDSLKIEMNRIKSIIEQLLGLAGPDEQDKEICTLLKVFSSHPIEVEINRLREAGYIITLDLLEKSPQILATRNQIQQVLLQLLENAEEAMEEPGKIEISLKNISCDDGRFVSISVKDSGIGMDEKTLKKIFKPFYTTKGREATGLGLMIISTIVDNLGGIIGIKSAPGEGTVFRIAIPEIG